MEINPFTATPNTRYLRKVARARFDMYVFMNRFPKRQISISPSEIPFLLPANVGKYLISSPKALTKSDVMKDIKHFSSRRYFFPHRHGYRILRFYQFLKQRNNRDRDAIAFRVVKYSMATQIRF